MIKKETGIVLVTLAGLCVSQCIEKDYLLKPVFCTVLCGVSTYYSGKITYQAASATYDKYVKPGLKALLANSK